jgi:hypothetical protein
MAHALLGAAVGAMLLPALFFAFVFASVFMSGNGAPLQLAEGASNIAFLLGVLGLFAATTAFGFAVLMATVVHEVFRRLRWRRSFAFVLAGLLLYAIAGTLLFGVTEASTAQPFLFYPLAVPSVICGSVLFARKMRRLDDRAGVPWP